MPDGANGVVTARGRQARRPAAGLRREGQRVTEGTTVVTSGFNSAASVESIFPRGIPIGRVTRVDPDEVELYQRVHIKPFADLRRVDFVQVLTRRAGERRRPSRPDGGRAVSATPGAFARAG